MARREHALDFSLARLFLLTSSYRVYVDMRERKVRIVRRQWMGVLEWKVGVELVNHANQRVSLANVGLEDLLEDVVP